MTIKKIMLGLIFLFYFPAIFAFESIAQSLQIYTNFKGIIGRPSWLLELRDVESGQVFPYLFDIKNNDNFWIAFSKEHSYQIVASQVKFGERTIHNFCRLEGGVLKGKSMFITLTGTISPNRYTSECHVQKYSDTHFIVVKPEDVAPKAAQTAQSQPAQLQNAVQSITQNPLVSGIIGQPKAPSPATTAKTPATSSSTTTNAPASATSLTTVVLPPKS